MNAFNEIVGMLLLIAMVCTGIMIGEYVTQEEMRDAFAEGTLTCEIKNHKRICWNPKEAILAK